MAELESSGTRNLESDERASGEPVDSPEIIEVPRGDRTEERTGATAKDPLTHTRGMVQEEKRRNSSSEDNAEDGLSSGQNQGDLEVGNSNERIEQPNLSKEPNLKSMEEEYRTRFYEMYRREAEEYDKGFIKKCDEDLNTTLIFAGLFSAVTSAFIILVQSDFKPDPNEETAALLRIIIYKMDNTTLGGDIPTVPQWTGPPRTSVEVQAMLFASLVASLFSAFLAMLGKQWLNRYESIDVRGSAIERHRNRQQKLDGIDAWYFNPVMESLPLMLQGALFLLGCALSRYLWEINTSVALVILCGTSFGLLLYLFIVVAGAICTSCPYQTPVAQFLSYILDALGHIPNTHRHIWSSLRRIPSILHCITVSLHSTLSTAIRASFFCRTFIDLWDIIERRPRSLHNLACSFFLFLLLPIVFLWDTCRLWIFVIREVYRLTRKTELGEEVLDRRCILWTLRTSLDNPVRLSAVDYLSEMASLHIDPSFVTDCFNHLSRIVQRMDKLTEAYTLFCLSMVSHLTAGDPSLKILEDISGRYARALSTDIRSHRLPRIPTLHAIHHVLHAINPTGWRFYRPSWDNYKPTGSEHAIAAYALAKISQFEFRRSQLQKQKVPRYFLRFALHSLSLDPPPPTPVILNSLLIIATDLGCDVHIDASDESPDRGCSLITEELNTMVEAGDSDLIFSKRKAISALLPYAVTLEQRGQPELLNLFLRAAQSTNFKNFIWFYPLADTLFNTPYPRSLDRLILLATPYVWRARGPRSEDELARWALAVSACPYAEEVGEFVVTALLLVAADDSLRCRVPANVWAWLKKLQSPPRLRTRRSEITQFGVVHHIRSLGDVEILKLYLLIVLHNRFSLGGSGFTEMKVSVVEDFSGVGVSRHRRDLIKELEEVREYFSESDRPKYGELKELLLQVDMEAEKTLISSHSTFMCALPLPCP